MQRCTSVINICYWYGRLRFVQCHQMAIHAHNLVTTTPCRPTRPFISAPTIMSSAAGGMFVRSSHSSLNMYLFSIAQAMCSAWKTTTMYTPSYDNILTIINLTVSYCVSTTLSFITLSMITCTPFLVCAIAIVIFATTTSLPHWFIQSHALPLLIRNKLIQLKTKH